MDLNQKKRQRAKKLEGPDESQPDLISNCILLSKLCIDVVQLIITSIIITSLPSINYFLCFHQLIITSLPKNKNHVWNFYYTIQWQKFNWKLGIIFFLNTFFTLQRILYERFCDFKIIYSANCVVLYIRQ